MCILSVYTLLKVVGYFDLSMSVMGFQKKNWMGGWGELYPSFFGDFWNFIKFAKPLTALCDSNPSSTTQHHRKPFESMHNFT